MGTKDSISGVKAGPATARDVICQHTRRRRAAEQRRTAEGTQPTELAGYITGVGGGPRLGAPSPKPWMGV